MYVIKKAGTCLILMVLALATVKSQHHQYYWPITVGVKQEPRRQCEPPDGYNLELSTKDRRSYYKWFDSLEELDSFSRAKSRCSSDGAHLITIRTKHEGLVFTRFTSKSRSYLRFQGWLRGVKKLHSLDESKFVHIDKMPDGVHFVKNIQCIFLKYLFSIRESIFSTFFIQQKKSLKNECF